MGSQDQSKVNNVNSKMQTTFRTTLNMNSQEDEIGDLSPAARQQEIKRITSNLPEVYNKYFFTATDEITAAAAAAKASKDKAKNKMNETSPAALTVIKKGFSLSKNQKEEQINANTGANPAEANSKIKDLTEQAQGTIKQYLNKNVFHKTMQGSFTGFRRKVPLDEVQDDLHSNLNSMEGISAIDKGIFASIKSSQEGAHFLPEKQQSQFVEVHVKQMEDAPGRKTQQKLLPKDIEALKQQQLGNSRISAMAKTQDDGSWPKEFDFEDEEEHNQGRNHPNNQESYHTLKRRPTANDEIDKLYNEESRMLDAVAQPSVHSISKVGSLKRAELPDTFKNSTLTGFKNMNTLKSDAPSCFCEKQGPCEKHLKFQPTIESMLELLEDQVQSLNKDEKSLEENLDFIGKSMDTILLSRRDTFKEHITRAYAAKERELEQYKQKCEEMEENDQAFQKSTLGMQELARENMRLQREISDLRMQST